VPPALIQPVLRLPRLVPAQRHPELPFRILATATELSAPGA